MSLVSGVGGVGVVEKAPPADGRRYNVGVWRTVGLGVVEVKIGEASSPLQRLLWCLALALWIGDGRRPRSGAATTSRLVVNLLNGG